MICASAWGNERRCLIVCDHTRQPARPAEGKRLQKEMGKERDALKREANARGQREKDASQPATIKEWKNKR